MAKNNFPTGQLDAIPENAVQQLVTDLNQLHNMGKPQTDEECEKRIAQYFEFCQKSSIRPGIETLCLALHVTRQTLYNWGNGSGCSNRRQEAIQTAKMFVSSYLEQASLSGKLNPASSIFLLKNWFNYKDSFSFETTAQNKDMYAPTRTPEEIASALEQIEKDIPIDTEFYEC